MGVPHSLEHIGKLGLGVVLGTGDVGAREATSSHGIVGTVVHILTVLASPFAVLIERTGLCLVDEVVVEQLDGRQGAYDGVSLGLYPVFLGVSHVDAQP